MVGNGKSGEKKRKYCLKRWKIVKKGGKRWESVEKWGKKAKNCAKW